MGRARRVQKAWSCQPSEAPLPTNPPVFTPHLPPRKLPDPILVGFMEALFTGLAD